MVPVFERILDDHQWYPKILFRVILESYGWQAKMLLAVLDAMPGLCESDCGSFVCLPNHTTPLEAPDEKLGFSMKHVKITDAQLARAEKICGRELKPQRKSGKQKKSA